MSLPSLSTDPNKALVQNDGKQNKKPKKKCRNFPKELSLKKVIDIN